MAKVKRQMSSTWAFIVYVAAMVSGFVFATIFPAAPYEIYAWAVTAGVGAYWGKRLAQKSTKFGANGSTNGVDPAQPIGD